MNKALKYFLFSFAFIFVGLLVGFRIKDSMPGERSLSFDQNLQKLQQAISFIRDNYVEEQDQNVLVDQAIKGIIKEMDPHSHYFPASVLQGKKETMEGSFDGIGVEFSLIKDTIYVVAPLNGGPSEKLGIMAGDRIIKVDGELVAGQKIGYDDVYDYLKGPRGSKVVVSIARRGLRELIDFEITRDKIPINSVDYSYMFSETAGYMKVSNFAETTYNEFKRHLTELQKEGMQSLVLDLRNNPGGYLSMAYKMADEFLTAGKLVVATEGRISQSKQRYESTSTIGSFEEGTLVILIDYGSASASEIVAGAVQDHDRGLVVGVRSFGKGLVQIQKEFEDGSAIRIVIAQYYTPSGRCIQKPYDKTAEEYDHEIAERFESGEIFDASKTVFPDSLKFTTTAGRTVYGGGGIFPDVFIPDDTTKNSLYLSRLASRRLFRTFCYEYVDRHPEIEQRYQSSKAFLGSFKPSEAMVNEFIAYAEEGGVAYQASSFARSQELIVNRIKAFVGRRLFGLDGFYPVLLEVDNVFQESIALMPVARKLEETGKLVLAEKSR